MSFVKLTQFYIANWRPAPCAGLGELPGRAGLQQPDRRGPAALVHRSRRSTPCSSSDSAWALRDVRGPGAAAQRSGAAACCARCSSCRTPCRSTRASSPGTSCSSGTTAWSTTSCQTTCTSGDHAPFWLMGDNAFLVHGRSSRSGGSWPFAFLMLMAGLQSIPTTSTTPPRSTAPATWQQARHITLPLAAAGQRGAAADAVPVDVQRLQHAVRAVRGDAAEVGGDLISFHIYDNSFLNWNFGLGSAMSVLLLLFLLRRHRHSISSPPTGGPVDA